MNYKDKVLHNRVKAEDLVRFEVIEKETDLLILAEGNFYEKALESLLNHRDEIEGEKEKASAMVKEMHKISKKLKVSSMATFGGALAETVGKDLLPYSNELIVENGGDIFIKTNQKRKVIIYADGSPFSGKIALEIEPQEKPFAVCTSSGNREDAFNFGKADAVTVIARNAFLADAAATAIGNQIKDSSDIDQALKFAKKIRGLDGVLILKDDQMGMLGKVKIVSN